MLGSGILRAHRAETRTVCSVIVSSFVVPASAWPLLRRSVWHLPNRSVVFAHYRTQTLQAVPQVRNPTPGRRVTKGGCS